MTHIAHAIDILDHVDTGLDWLDGAECVDEIGRAQDVAEARAMFRELQDELRELNDDE